MTIFSQFTAIVLVAFSLVFVGTVSFNIENTREYLDEQLSSHAQDTATSLGLSLSPHLAKDDLAVVRSMVDAIFDRGYYQEIAVSSASGKSIVDRKLEVEVDGVPAWFIAALPIRTPPGEAHLLDGWKQGGKVRVRSHPGFAYRELWSNAIDTLTWAIGIVLLAALLTIVLVRSLLRPLRAMEAQAIAISERRFLQVGQIPGTRELRQVVLAMNKMSLKVRQMLAEQVNLAERMREEAYSDPVTRLGNRRSLERRLQAMVSDPEGGAEAGLLLVALAGLSEVNRVRGYRAGDELLQAAATTVTGTVERTVSSDSVPEPWVARAGGSEFAVLLPGAEPSEVDALAGALCDELRTLTFGEVGLIGAHIGAAYFDGEQSGSELLAAADLALRRAQTSAEIGWSGDPAGRTPSSPPAGTPRSTQSRGAERWRAALAEIVAERQVVLHYQPVRAIDSSQVLHYEALARIPADPATPGSEYVPAGLFWPMAARLGYARVLDQMVVDLVLARARDEGAPGPGESPSGVRYAINLSPQSLVDPRFVAWLVNEVGRSPESASRVVFELPEYAALGHLETVRELARQLGRAGSGLAIDHFAASARSFGYLHSIDVRYLKFDGSFAAALPDNADERFFVGTLVDVAHGLDIPVIAEHVQTSDEAAVLEALRFDGLAGHFIGAPARL